MIKEILSAVAEMSITGSYIILAILIIRAAIKRLPKRFSYMLWAIPAVRLLCPFIKDELFVITYSDSGARIEKIMPSIMCRTETIDQRESDYGNPIMVFIDEISGEEYILDIQASAVAFKCLSYQQDYYPLDKVPN